MWLAIGKGRVTQTMTNQSGESLNSCLWKLYFTYGKECYNISYKDSWVLNDIGEPQWKKKNVSQGPSEYDMSHCWLPLWRARPWGQSTQEFDCSSFPGWSRQQFLLNQSLHWKHLKQIITRKMSVKKRMLNSFFEDFESRTRIRTHNWQCAFLISVPLDFFCEIVMCSIFVPLDIMWNLSIP